MNDDLMKAYTVYKNKCVATIGCTALKLKHFILLFDGMKYANKLARLTDKDYIYGECP